MSTWRMFDGSGVSLYGDGPSYAEVVSSAGTATIFLPLDRWEPGPAEVALIIMMPAGWPTPPVPFPIFCEALVAVSRAQAIALHGHDAVAVDALVRRLMAPEVGHG